MRERVHASQTLNRTVGTKLTEGGGGDGGGGGVEGEVGGTLKDSEGFIYLGRYNSNVQVH